MFSAFGRPGNCILLGLVFSKKRVAGVVREKMLVSRNFFGICRRERFVRKQQKAALQLVPIVGLHVEHLPRTILLQLIIQTLAHTINMEGSKASTCVRQVLQAQSVWKPLRSQEGLGNGLCRNAPQLTQASQLVVFTLKLPLCGIVASKQVKALSLSRTAFRRFFSGKISETSLHEAPSSPSFEERTED